MQEQIEFPPNVEKTLAPFVVLSVQLTTSELTISIAYLCNFRIQFNSDKFTMNTSESGERHKMRHAPKKETK